MTLSGTDWMSVQDVSQVSDAGNDLSNVIESATNQNIMDIRYTTSILILGIGANPFRIEVRKSDINWNGSIIPAVRRTGGTPDNSLLDILSNPSSITGGVNYQNITNISTTLFTGYGKVDNITLQYRFSGISLALPADDYETEIIYTMWDNE